MTRLTGKAFGILLVPLLAALSFAACDTNGPEKPGDIRDPHEEILGPYEAVKYISAQFWSGCYYTDVLSEGGYFRLSLGRSGKAASSLLLSSGSGTGTGTGSYTVRGDTIITTFPLGEASDSLVTHWLLDDRRMTHVSTSDPRLPPVCQPDIELVYGN